MIKIKKLVCEGIYSNLWDKKYSDINNLIWLQS